MAPRACAAVAVGQRDVPAQEAAPERGRPAARAARTACAARGGAAGCKGERAGSQRPER